MTRFFFSFFIVYIIFLFQFPFVNRHLEITYLTVSKKELLAAYCSDCRETDMGLGINKTLKFRGAYAKTGGKQQSIKRQIGNPNATAKKT